MGEEIVAIATQAEGVWAVFVPPVGRTTQALTWDEIPAMAADLVTSMTDEPVDPARVVVVEQERTPSVAAVHLNLANALWRRVGVRMDPMTGESDEARQAVDVLLLAMAADRFALALNAAGGEPDERMTADLAALHAIRRDVEERGTASRENADQAGELFDRVASAARAVVVPAIMHGGAEAQMDGTGGESVTFVRAMRDADWPGNDEDRDEMAAYRALRESMDEEVPREQCWAIARRRRPEWADEPSGPLAPTITQNNGGFWVCAISDTPLAGEGDTREEAIDDFVETARQIAMDWPSLCDAPSLQDLAPVVSHIRFLTADELRRWAVGEGS